MDKIVASAEIPGQVSDNPKSSVGFQQEELRNLPALEARSCGGYADTHAPKALQAFRELDLG